LANSAAFDLQLVPHLPWQLGFCDLRLLNVLGSASLAAASQGELSLGRGPLPASDRRELPEEILKMKLRILSLSADQDIALLRKRVLELAGHEVVVPLLEKDAVKAASVKNRFDVAILCYRMWTGRSREIIRIFRETILQGRFS
jgi:hypothetical protein